MKTKKCPYCGEIIPKASIICPICGESLSTEIIKTKRFSTYIAGVVAVLMVTISVGIIIKWKGIRPRIEEPSAEQTEDFKDPEYIGEYAPEGKWTHSYFTGTLTVNGDTFNIELAISYPGTGDIYCDVVGGYRRKGNSTMIPLKGDWVDFSMGSVVILSLYSDQYREKFEFEFDEDDLLSTSFLQGEWAKYATEDDYSQASNPSATSKVFLSSTE